MHIFRYKNFNFLLRILIYNIYILNLKYVYATSSCINVIIKARLLVAEKGSKTVVLFLFDAMTICTRCVQRPMAAQADVNIDVRLI